MDNLLRIKGDRSSEGEREREREREREIVATSVHSISRDGTEDGSTCTDNMIRLVILFSVNK